MAAIAGEIAGDKVVLSDSVIMLISDLFGNFTTLVATKCLPMKTRILCGHQRKAETLGAFWRWPITRCFIKSDRAGLIIGHSINLRLNGEHWRAVQCQTSFYRLRFYLGEWYTFRRSNPVIYVFASFSNVVNS